MTVKIADFGTVMRPGSSGSVKTTSLSNSTALLQTATLGTGTPLWMAPEVQEGKFGIAHYGAPVDVYSFGMVMFVAPFPFGLNFL